MVGGKAAKGPKFELAFGILKLDDLGEADQIGELATTVLGAVFHADFGLLDSGENFGKIFARNGSRFVFERAVHDADGSFFSLRSREIPDEMRSNAAARPAC